MKPSRKSILLISASCMTVPVLAQDERSDIVVTAQMTADEIGKASHEMARTLTAVTVSDQVPRWASPICLRVEGLDAPLAEKVATKIKVIGAAAKARMAKGRCDPNVFVQFTNDSGSLAREIAGRLPIAEDGGSRMERAAFTSASGPLRWETRVALHDARHGRMVANSAALMNSGDYNIRLEAPVVDSTDSSLIRKLTAAAIEGMMVIVDGNAAEGIELGQLSEYIAMVVLARPPMSVSYAKHPSILNLARHQPPGSSPTRLTDWDRAYLAALYAAPLDRSASATRSIIAKRMTTQLSRDN